MDVVFRDLKLTTAPGRVMTPRPASEAHVEAAVQAAGERPARIADVGTGSGAIALALAIALPRAEVVATDRSAAAVALARANACRLGLGGRVSIYHGDLLEPVSGPLDLVVANLPYLPLAEASCHPDLRGEPPDAVFAPGDGLGPYRRLLAASRERLRPEGSVVLQLRRRVLVSPRGGIDELLATLAPPLPAAAGGAAWAY